MNVDSLVLSGWRSLAKFTQTLLVALIFTSITSAAHAEKIRTAVPQANLNYLSVLVADAKGFFRDEGLDNETVVISGPLSIAALLSGDVDYSGAGGSGMRAALKGAPVRGIIRAVSPGVPGLPSPEGIKNFLEYDIKIPMRIKEDIPPEILLHLRFIEEVIRELGAAQRR